MRRSTKPFTVEVKKRGGRRRDGMEPAPERVSMPIPSFGESVGRDLRFRDAESFFKPLPPVEPEAVATPNASLAEEPASSSADQTQRRILPDLIAEAALTETKAIAAPEAPRRRGRPPKPRDTDAPPPVRARKMPEPELALDFDDDAPSVEIEDVAVIEAPPAVLYLAASARRRARRATDSLPRAERWKRRLPKVCW